MTLLCLPHTAYMSWLKVLTFLNDILIVFSANYTGRKHAMRKRGEGVIEFYFQPNLGKLSHSPGC